MRELQPLLSPRSIALVGASGDRTKLSGLPLFFLQKHGYAGRLFPINPRATEVCGLGCYASLSDVGEPIDLAFLLVGAERVLEVIDECVRVGVRSAIVAASGFAEVGGSGAEQQRLLAERIRGTGLRVLGPNCMGMVNVRDGVAASFSQSLFVDHLIPGRLAFFSQSGAIGGSTLDMAFSRGIGLSHWVSTGNQVDVDVVECASAVIDDPDVRVIGLYLEGLRDPNAYVALLERAADLGKQVLVLKSGQSEVGARAAISHTAAMVGNAAVFQAVSRQYGAVLVQDLEELLDRAAALLAERVASGTRVGVVSSSGGVGVILADEVERQGLTMAELTDATRARLSTVVPDYGSTSNPVDATATLVARMMGGESGLWTEAFAAVADDPNVDQLIIGLTMITGSAGETLADEVVGALERTKKPILVSWLGADLCRDAFNRLRAAGVPMYPSTGRVVRAAGTLVARSLRLIGTQPVREILDLPDLTGALTEWACQPLLRGAGIATPASCLIALGEQPSSMVRFDGPYVVKVQSPDILHKSDAGGIALGIERSGLSHARRSVLAQVDTALPPARIEGVMIQQQLSGGLEMLVSVTRDPDFGLMLTLGTGGILTELLHDVSTRRLPVDEPCVRGMLAELRGAALLAGLRGAAPRDVDALVQAVLAVGRLAESIGDRLEELEINPLLVMPEGAGAYAVDCLIRLR